MMKRKGQGAMEYLMTYGWAILVVMIVGVVLWQLGIFGGGPGSTPTARGFGRIKVMDPSIKYAGTSLSFTIMNGAGSTVSALKVGIVSGSCPSGLVVGIPASLSIGAGSTANLTITGCEVKAAGDSFAVDIGINYTETVAGNPVTHAEKGTLRGSAEAV